MGIHPWTCFSNQSQERIFFKTLDNTYFTVVKTNKKTNLMTLPWKSKPISYNSDKIFEYICRFSNLSKLKFMWLWVSSAKDRSVASWGEEIYLPVWEEPWTSEGWKHIPIYYETLIACLRRCVLFLFHLCTAESVRVISGAIPTRNCWFWFVILFESLYSVRVTLISMY